MRKLIPLFIAGCFMVASFMSCDVTGEQNFDFEPADSLLIVGPTTVSLPSGAPTQVTYNSKAFTVNKEYEWAVEGNARIDSVYREGGFVDVTFSQTGTNTITVNDGEYAGSITVTVE